MRRRALLLGLGGLLFMAVLPGIAEAQTDVRFYLVPKIGDGLSFETAFRPKYTDQDALGAGWDISGRWSAMDYGLESLFLIGIEVAPGEHVLLNAQPDVIAIPTPITDNVSSAAVSVVRARLEGANLPAAWVTTAFTYQQVLAIVGRVVAFAQRYHGLFNRPIFEGITLDSQINQLTQAQRTRLQQTAQSLGLDYSAVQSTSTIRQVLKLIADQMPGFVLRGVQF